jgi:hypothetical protein
MDIPSILHHCDDALDSTPVRFEAGEAPQLEVPLAWRVRLWATMNAAYPADSLVRRNLLASAIANRAALEWDHVKESIPAAQRQLPHELLGICRRALRGEVTEQQAAREVDINQVEATMELLEDIGLAAYAALACHAAVKSAVGYEEAVYQEYFYPHVWAEDFPSKCEESRDWMGWDAHFWASCAAGGFPGITQFSPEKRIEFWRRWLREDVPAVLIEAVDLDETFATVIKRGRDRSRGNHD